MHRDGKRYHGIVVIVTLDGESRLVSCVDRAGSAKRRIDDRPGRVVLLTATEFDGRSDEAVRPLHMVDQVHGGRLSIGFRYEPSGHSELAIAADGALEPPTCDDAVISLA